MVSKTVTVLLTVMMAQTISGQYVRNACNTYGNELAANIAAENMAYSQSFGPIAANAVAFGATASNSLAYVPTAANALAYGPNAANAMAYAPAEVAYEIPLVAGNAGLNFGLSLAELGASNGGGLRVQSASSIPASGLTVDSDNMLIEGPLAVSGQLPFLGVVALEGPLVAAGSGSVAYGCGNGNVGIVSEGVDQPAPAYPNTLPGYPNSPCTNGLPVVAPSPALY